MTNSNSSSGRKFGDKGSGNMLVAAFYQPVKLLSWLTGQSLPSRSKSRGEIIVLSTLALACAALSVEAWYEVMPRNLVPTGNASASANHKFVPKPYIEDGADIGLANPVDAGLMLVDAGLKVLDATLPFNIKLRVPYNQNSIWLDPNFYVALLLSLMLQTFQAKALRAVSVEIRKRRVEKAKQFKPIDLSPDELAITKIRTIEYNNVHVAGYVGTMTAILFSFGLEIGIGLSSLSAATTVNGVAQLIYVIAQAFGFEFFVNILLGMDEDEAL